MEYAAIGTQELEEGEGRVVQVGRRKVLVLNIEGDYYALDSYCAHRAAPLVNGEVVNGQLLCPWHGNTFDVATGTCRAMPEESVRTYPVRVHEGKVWVRLEEGEG